MPCQDWRLNMDILNPPEIYVKWRCHMHKVDCDDFEKERKKFYDKFPETQQEISNFCNWLYEARHKYSLPIEKIEVREEDGKKHGWIVPMMIYDIEYWLEAGNIKKRKAYIPLIDLCQPPQRKPLQRNFIEHSQPEEEIPF